MRLLLITNVFPNPYQPTRGVFNLQMARALAQDHELQVISPISWVEELRARRNGNGILKSGRSEVMHGIKVHYPRYYYTPKVLRSQYGRFLWHSVRPAVGRVLQRFAPDAVLGYWIHPDGEVAVRVARQIGVPAVVMSGGSGVLVLGKKGGRRRCIGKVLQSADVVVAVSQDLKNKIIAFGLPPEKAHVVPRGADGELFSPGGRTDARPGFQIPE